MRVLTVRQPWAGAIIYRGKDVENRSRNIAGGYRGPVAIHVALRHDYDAVEAHNEIAGYVDHHSIFGYGKIIGMVDLADAHLADECHAASIQNVAHLFRTDRAAFDELPVTGNAGGLISRAGYCSPWAEPDCWHLKLADPRPLRNPIPYRGGLGLRRLDEATTALVAPEMMEGISS